MSVGDVTIQKQVTGVSTLTNWHQKSSHWMQGGEQVPPEENMWCWISSWGKVSQTRLTQLICEEWHKTWEKAELGGQDGVELLQDVRVGCTLAHSLHTNSRKNEFKIKWTDTFFYLFFVFLTAETDDTFTTLLRVIIHSFKQRWGADV